MRDGHLLKRAGREFVNNLAWMLVAFGSLGAILVFATQLPLLWVAAYVGISASALAAIVTVFTVLALWSGAYDERTRLGGHDSPGSPPDRGGWDDVEKWTGNSGGGYGGGGL